MSISSLACLSQTLARRAFWLGAISKDNKDSHAESEIASTLTGFSSTVQFFQIQETEVGRAFFLSYRGHCLKRSTHLGPTPPRLRVQRQASWGENAQPLLVQLSKILLWLVTWEIVQTGKSGAFSFHQRQRNEACTQVTANPSPRQNAWVILKIMRLRIPVNLESPDLLSVLLSLVTTGWRLGAALPLFCGRCWQHWLHSPPWRSSPGRGLQLATQPISEIRGCAEMERPPGIRVS